MAEMTEITDFAASQLDVYARLSEVQLRRYREPECGIFIAESPKVITRALDAGYTADSFLAEQGKLAGETGEVLARCPEIPVYTAPKEMLTELTGFSLTRGLLCAMNRRRLPTVEQICAGARRIVVLEHVVNPTNVGAIFRSAAALHMDAVLLTPDCSAARPGSAWGQCSRSPGLIWMTRRCRQISAGRRRRMGKSSGRRFSGILDLRRLRWRFVRTRCVLMIPALRRRKSWRSCLVQKGTDWLLRQSRTAITR